MAWNTLPPAPPLGIRDEKIPKSKFKTFFASTLYGHRHFVTSRFLNSGPCFNGFQGGVRGGKRIFLFSEFWVEFVKNKYQNLMVIQFGTAQGQSHFFRRFIVFWHGWRGKVSIDFWHAEGVPKIDRNRAYAHGGVASTNDISNNFKKLAPKAPLKIF